MLHNPIITLLPLIAGLPDTHCHPKKGSRQLSRLRTLTYRKINSVRLKSPQVALSYADP
jgi:hypothetical protein